MTDKIDDGGSAFPTAQIWINGGNATEGVEFYGPGMSLRDWFAGQALNNQYTQHDGSPDKISEWAYQVANAMIEARKAKS